MKNEYRIVCEEPDSGMGGPALVVIYKGDECVKGNLYRKDAIAWIAKRGGTLADDPPPPTDGEMAGCAACVTCGQPWLGEIPAKRASLPTTSKE